MVADSDNGGWSTGQWSGRISVAVVQFLCKYRRGGVGADGRRRHFCFESLFGRGSPRLSRRTGRRRRCRRPSTCHVDFQPDFMFGTRERLTFRTSGWLVFHVSVLVVGGFISFERASATSGLGVASGNRTRMRRRRSGLQ